MLTPFSQGYRAPPGGRAPQFGKHWGRLEDTGFLYGIPRQGHPRPATPREDHHLFNTERHNRNTTASPLSPELYAAARTPVTKVAASRRFHERRRFARRPVICILVSSAKK
ncbi:hypothetical protein TNCV_4175521 [Trichonephila clavipes]|nr:hypothetical protein TNCV_4175521 [Trichonephila clavipes]